MNALQYLAEAVLTLLVLFGAIGVSAMAIGALTAAHRAIHPND